MIHTAPIANTDTFVYYLSVAKTKAIGFDSLYVQGGRTAPQSLAVFLRLHKALVRLLWAGYGGEGLGPAGFLERQSVNPAVCPPTLFDSRARVKLPVQGGHDMAAISIPVRSEQIPTPNTFHLAARAARKAARQWFAGIPTQSLAVWRDTCRQAAIDGLPNPKERGSAFDTAFACEIGNLIAGGRSHD